MWWCFGTLLRGLAVWLATQKVNKMASSVKEESQGVSRIEKLSRDNFFNWKFDMEMVLVGKDLWDIVSGEEVLEDGAAENVRKAYKKRDNRALSAICLSISSDLKIYVRNSKSAKEAWDALCNHFEEKSLSKKIFYRRKLYSLRMEKYF